MKTMKKVLAFMLALAMVVTAVPVTNAEAATGLPKSKSYYAGKTYTLKLTTPSSWKSVSTVWSATNNNTKAVAISDKKAKSVTVKALKKGKAVVTAKVTYKKSGVKTTKTYKCNVRVKAPTIAITQKAITVEVDKTANITAKYVPASATVSFESEDDTVAAVKDLGNGKAVVTGVMPGQSTNIKAYLRCGKKVKMSIVKVTVTGEALADGVSAKLMNQFMDYENVVIEDNVAKVRVYYGKGSKGISDKSVSLYMDGVYADTRVTDANGFIYFNIETDPDEHGFAFGNHTYKFVVEATGESCEGKLVVAKVDTTDVVSVNVKGRPEADNKFYKNMGFNNLEVSTNDKNVVYGDGWTESWGTFTHHAANQPSNTNVFDTYKVEYVDSQQVSPEGTTTHKVGFIGGLPRITFPGTGDNLNVATKYNQPVNKTIGEYHIYEDGSTGKSEVVALDKNPNELTYATVNFKNLKLSEYTKLVISVWKDEASAKAASWNEWEQVTKGNNKIGDDYTIAGAYSKDNFSYQIPLRMATYDSLAIRVEIISKGQVNTALNKGLEIVDIDCVLKDKSGAQAGRTEIIKGAKVEWSIEQPKYSEVRQLPGDVADAIKKAADVAIKVQGEVAKVTYQVPVYPYTGNAIITTYDKNDKVIAYYACPVVNNGWVNALGERVRHDATRGFNENVLDIYSPADFCYRISEEEAFHSVGTILSQEELEGRGTLVSVNSEKSGYTNLVGKIVCPDVAGYTWDATNSEVHTSVQWNPIPNAAAGVVHHAGAIALAGQEMIVTAQLVDRNGNAVSTANQAITFKYDDNDNKTSDVVIRNTDSVLKTPNVAAADAAMVSVSAVTDTKGQAKLVLKSATAGTVITGVTATTNNYKVVLKLADRDIEIVDLYWINARPKFVPSALTAPTELSTDPNYVTDEAEVNTSATNGLNPKTGEAWEYGFQTMTETLPAYGEWAGFHVAPCDVKINLGVKTGSVGTTNTNTGVNGMAHITSTKDGVTQLVGQVTGKAVDGKTIGFYVMDKNHQNGVYYVTAGSGETVIDNKLILNVKWGLKGQDAEFISVGGNKSTVTSGGSYVIYFKVKDQNGNAYPNQVVKVKPDSSSIIKNITTSVSNGGSADALTSWGTPYQFATDGEYTLGKTDKNGIVAIEVERQALTRIKSVITAEAVGIDDQQFTTIIDWVDATGTLKVDKGQDTVTGDFKTRAVGKKIYLTFTEDIVASSVLKDQFAVWYLNEAQNATKEVEIVSVEVSGKTIIITMNAEPLTTAVNIPYFVVYKPVEKDSVKYAITSTEGNVQNLRTVAQDTSVAGYTTALQNTVTGATTSTTGVATIAVYAKNTAPVTGGDKTKDGFELN